jgi:tetratricopeptide (TPR) repeat protein
MVDGRLRITASMSSSSTAAVAKSQEVSCLEEPGDSAASRGLESRLFQLALFQSRSRRTFVLCLLLTVVVLVFYNPIAHNGFIYDDNGYIVGNPHVRAGLTWETVKWSFTTYQQANWHPLTWLSHALDCQLFGLNPVGPHYVNVLLHAADAVLLFLLLQSATGFTWRGLMVAALFALHPVNVESVAWAAERKNVLSTLFFLLALYAYGWYARRPGLGRYSVVFFSFALSLLCKPQAITFPFLLFLWDYWPLERIGVPASAQQSENLPRSSRGWLVLEKVPLLLLSAGSAVITMKAQKAGGAIQTFSQYSPLLRLETAAISYVRYIGKALWPSRLAALYPHPTKLYPAWQFAAALFLLLLVTAVVIRIAAIQAPDRRYLAMGWFWFLGSLVPMIGLIQVGSQAMADRYAYIPFVGLFVMVTWLVADRAQAYRISARWLAIPAVACLLVLGVLTDRQVGYWHDPESFWLRTLALTKDNYVAEVNLGDYLINEGRADDAATHFRAALVIRPDGLVANLNLGSYEQDRGNLTAAIDRYQVVAVHATDVSLRGKAYDNLGFAYRQMGQLLKARRCFERALELEPDRTIAMVGLGMVAQMSGDLPEAVRQYSHAMTLQPTDVGYLLLARALQEEGRSDEAEAILERVKRHSANFPEAQKEAQSLLSGK